jgi:hypothetical protein
MLDRLDVLERAFNDLARACGHPDLVIERPTQTPPDLDT